MHKVFVMGEFHEFNKIIQTKNELQKCKQIEMQQVEREKKRKTKILDHRITRTWTNTMIIISFLFLYFENSAARIWNQTK